MNKIYLLIAILLIVLKGVGQTQADSINVILNQKAKLYPELNSKIDISVSDVSLDEFLRAIAVSNSVNLNISDDLNFQVVNNFSGVTVKDMLSFLCQQYNLQLTFTGNIISIKQIKLPGEPYNPEKLAIEYDAQNKLITFNFKNDSLILLAEQITKLSNVNVVVAPELHNKLVSAYIQNKPMESALDKLAFANNLKVSFTDDGFFLIENGEEAVSQEAKSENNSSRSTRRRSGGNTNARSTSSNDSENLQVKKVSDGKVNIVAENYPMDKLIKKVSEELNRNYFIVSKLDDKANVNLENTSYDQLLDHLFDGSKIAYKKTNQYYVIGDRSASELTETRVITLQNRTVNKLLENIPDDVIGELNVKEFLELNSLLVNGNQVLVDDFEQFIHRIDQTVPVILIEVMIVYVNKTKNLSTGISAGIGDAPAKMGGTLNPGLDLTLGTAVLDNMINSFDGFGWLNLSELTPNFYLSLKALEAEGYLDISSTPKLSTLNGHEATLSIGNTEYYQEEQFNTIGTQNPSTQKTITYKNVTADLSLTILPIVSGKENITMEIEVSQSDFTERIDPLAPPNTVNREFKSFIRVKNGEMILLGGLEEAEKSGSSSGWPILSRIPIIKWFFSSRTKKSSDSKLTVFIKPTIIP